MNATALAAWLAIPQEDRDGVVALLRTRADAEERAGRMAVPAASKSTTATKRRARQFARDADRGSRALAAAAVLLASVEPGNGASRPALRPEDTLVPLGLSRQTWGGLLAAGITQIRDLTNRTAGDLLAIPGFGVGCLQEVMAALATHGLRLVEGAS